MPPWHNLVLRGIANPVSFTGFPGSNPGGGAYDIVQIRAVALLCRPNLNIVAKQGFARPFVRFGELQDQADFIVQTFRSLRRTSRIPGGGALFFLCNSYHPQFKTAVVESRKGSCKEAKLYILAVYNHIPMVYEIHGKRIKGIELFDAQA